MLNIEKYTVASGATLLETLGRIDRLSAELTLTLFVLDGDGRTVGSVTDGDIRRGLLRGVGLGDAVDGVMSRDFTYLEEGRFDLEKLKYIKEKHFKIVPVLDAERRIVRIVNFSNGRSFLPVDAVLMAGGRGERLRPATLTTPKPLLPVAGKPIIEYNVENLLHNGIEHISVTVNYLAEQLEAHFSRPRENGVRIECVREPEYLGTLGSVKFIERWYNDSVLVMNSDLFTNINLEDFFIHFREHGADMSIAAIPYSVSVPYGVFEIENQREIKGVKEKPSYHYYANAGIYLIRREVLDLVPEGCFFNATDLMDLLIRARRKVIRFPISGYWIDIGKPEDFRKVQDLAQHIRRQED